MRLVWFISVLIIIKFSEETELSSSNLGKGSPARSQPISKIEITVDSLTFELRSNLDDTELAQYIFRYKPEYGDWEIIRILHNQPRKVKLENLLCGTSYDVQVTEYNSDGRALYVYDFPPIRTLGDKPENPRADKFIEVLSNDVILHLDEWYDGGCPMLYFVVEQKKKISTEWILVNNAVKPGSNFTLTELEPAVRYDLRVTAHNSAGFKVAEYEFATLNVTEGSPHPSPPISKIEITVDSLTIELRRTPDYTEPVEYIIGYQPEYGDRKKIPIPDNQPRKVKLENLLCGTSYEVHVGGYNSDGLALYLYDLPPTRTLGDKPENPIADKFIEVLSNDVILHLDAWYDGGCPMLYFVVEQKKKISTEWILVNNAVKPGSNFTLTELEPAVRYDLRVTAHNSAGFKVAEYEFATLNVTGGNASV